MTYADAFHALSDPRRREIAELLAAEPASVGALADRLPISRPAVSQHLKVLTDAGLTRVEQVGTRRVYSLDPTGLSALRAYLDRLWADALSAFEAEAHRIHKKDMS